MNKVYSFLCLIARARKLFSGGEIVEKKMKSKNVYLVIVASDASDNTKKRFCDKCKNKSVEMKIFGTKSLLGKYIGKGDRSVIGIIDINFAKKMLMLIEESYNKNGGEANGKGKSI